MCGRTILVVVIIFIIEINRHTHVIIGAAVPSLALQFPVGDAGAEVHKLVEMVFEILLVTIEQLLHLFLLF